MSRISIEKCLCYVLINDKELKSPAVCLSSLFIWWIPSCSDQLGELWSGDVIGLRFKAWEW